MNANPDFVTFVMRNSRVWDCVAEDGVRPEQFSYDPSNTYFQFQDLGFVMFRTSTVGMQEIHVAMLRGEPGLREFVLACIAIMRHRGVRKFLAPIGDWNKPALRLARACGFKEEGRVSGAYTRGGKPHAMVLMGGN